jgi:hypothetical protein
LIIEMGVLERRIPIASPSFSVEESIEGHHVFDFDGVNAESRRNRLDRIVADMTELLLDRYDNIHQTAAVGRELFDEVLDGGVTTQVHRQIPVQRSRAMNIGSGRRHR